MILRVESSDDKIRCVDVKDVKYEKIMCAFIVFSIDEAVNGTYCDQIFMVEKLPTQEEFDKLLAENMLTTYRFTLTRELLEDLIGRF